MIKPINLEARDIPDAWYQLIYNIFNNGKAYHIDDGSFKGGQRLEYDYVNVLIKMPESRPLLPVIEPHYNIPNPVDENYLNDYVTYLMTSDKKPNEDYTYGERLEPQIDEIIERYNKGGHRNNQLVLQIANTGDLNLNDPPCLRHIDTRIQDGNLHFFIYFRSWDLWCALPANLAAIQYLKEYMCDHIDGVKPGISYISSKGLHLYDYVWDQAKCLINNDVNIMKGW